MATISVYGYEVSCDPGINNITSYKGSINAADVQPDMNLTRIVEDKWWLSDLAPRFGKLTLLELRDNGALFRYGGNDFLVEFGKSKEVAKVGLSYAYAELHVKIEY